jgi:hypothetical protein
MNAAKTRTEAQITRAETRESSSGKFSKLNPCECCGKGAGANYSSDDRCNDTGFGVVLCKRCAKKLATLSDAEYLAAFTKS